MQKALTVLLVLVAIGAGIVRGVLEHRASRGHAVKDEHPSQASFPTRPVAEELNASLPMPPPMEQMSDERRVLPDAEAESFPAPPPSGLDRSLAKPEMAGDVKTTPAYRSALAILDQAKAHFHLASADPDREQEELRQSKALLEEILRILDLLQEEFPVDLELERMRTEIQEFLYDCLKRLHA